MGSFYPLHLHFLLSLEFLCRLTSSSPSSLSSLHQTVLSFPTPIFIPILLSVSLHHPSHHRFLSLFLLHFDVPCPLLFCSSLIPFSCCFSMMIFPTYLSPISDPQSLLTTSHHSLPRLLITPHRHSLTLLIISYHTSPSLLTTPHHHFSPL